MSQKQSTCAAHAAWTPARPVVVFTLLAVGLLCGLLRAPSAIADADPASDVLLEQNAFYPYIPRVPAALEDKLNALLSDAKTQHLPLKVAIIGSREDLGAIPDFFGAPQKYADFLEREIDFNAPQPLLVVMQAGLALAAVGPASSVAHVKIPLHARSSGLTEAAIAAVQALGRANGRTLTPVPANTQTGANATNSRSNSKPAIVLLYALPVLLIVLAGAPIAIRNRRGPQDRD